MNTRVCRFVRYAATVLLLFTAVVCWAQFPPQALTTSTTGITPSRTTPPYCKLPNFATLSLPTPVTGEGWIVYDSTTDTLKIWDGLAWDDYGTGVGGPFLPLAAGLSYPLSGSLYPSTTGSFDFGSSALYWKSLYGRQLNLGGSNGGDGNLHVYSGSGEERWAIDQQSLSFFVGGIPATYLWNVGATGHFYWYAGVAPTAGMLLVGNGTTGRFEPLDGAPNDDYVLTSDTKVARGMKWQALAEADTLDSVTTRGATTTNAITVGNITSGAAGADGKLTLYSEQGATDYSVGLNPNSAMTSAAQFYLPADEPAGTYFLKMTPAGVMTFDSATYMPTSGGDFTGNISARNIQLTYSGETSFWNTLQSGFGGGLNNVLYVQYTRSFVPHTVFSLSYDIGTGAVIAYVGGSMVWNASNDGSGSGLDAGLLEGLAASAFATSGHTHTGVYLPFVTSAAGWLHNDGLGAYAWSTPSYSDVGAAPSAAGVATPANPGDDGKLYRASAGAHGWWTPDFLTAEVDGIIGNEVTNTTDTTLTRSGSGTGPSPYTLGLNLAATNIWTANGAASTPGVTYSGTWFTGGTATTTKPQLLVEPAGTTSNAWSTNGTGIGVNAATGFTGNLLQLQLASANKFKVDYTGFVTTASSIYAGGYFYCAPGYGNYLYASATSTGHLWTFTGPKHSNTTTAQSNFVAILPSYNQGSGAASNSDLVISRYEQALGSGVQYLIDAGTNSAVDGSGVHTRKFGVTNLGIQTMIVGANVASADTIAATGPVFHVTGTTTINTITVPLECVSGCILTLIPDGLWSTGVTGNIAIATTGVVSKKLVMTYDAGTSKWYPSY